MGNKMSRMTYNTTRLKSKNKYKLNPVELKKVKAFVPPVKEGKVIKCYDGDTITIISDLYGTIYKFSVRINRIDCPEMKSNNANEKFVANLAKTRLANLVLDKNVCLQNVSTDKYGRLLADVYIGKISCAELLLKERLAVSYDGGTKIRPKNWKTYYENGFTD